ncbi:zinc ribbon domain-containing protein [Roseibium sp. MMSF_3544]|uniref:FmdB family zinc ribbon protein n=1 Tax=unclassified Roseibium TaxID=2629323 RepID=UPI00273CFC88|nr:zinc ribbon domain-containing protein [Roseibium sp. MMSF_3544]
MSLLHRIFETAMPVYEYICNEHGPFEAVRPLADYASPCACPVCGSVSPRAMLTAPNVSGLSSERRVAHATNERAADSPKRLSSHGPGMSKGRIGGRNTIHRPDGTKQSAAARPWMLSR